MIIRILGCHGSELTTQGSRGALLQCRACGFLVNDECMIDGGSISATLLESEQDKIRHIFVSHAHFDHIKGIPLLADNIAGRSRKEQIHVWSLPEILNVVRRHIFNDEIYPDFSRLPTVEEAPLVFQSFPDEKPMQVDGLHITSVRVNHTVPAVGFIVRDSTAAFVYSGDTAETQRIWDLARKEPLLKAAFIETSFPNELRDLAKASGHLTPDGLKREVMKLARPDIRIYIYHLKPSYREQILSEVRDLGMPNVHFLEEGEQVQL